MTIRSDADVGLMLCVLIDAEGAGWGWRQEYVQASVGKHMFSEPLFVHGDAVTVKEASTNQR